MLAALRTAVASVSSELAEKNAVARVLAQHGHRRPPAVVSQRDASGVTRVYLWDDAGIALVTGPSLQGTVYEVHAVPADADPTSFDLFIPAARGRSAFAAGRKAKALANPAPRTAPARAPLAQAPRRIGATPAPQPPVRQPAVLARHNPPARPLLSNPPKGPPASIPGPAGFFPAADDEYGYNILAKLVGPNKVYSIPNAVLAATMRRVVKDLGLADTISVEKGEGGIYDVRFNAKQGTILANEAKALKSVMSASIYSTYGTMGFYKPSEPDPYADYTGPAATIFYAPYVNYVEALLFGALAANDIATLPGYTPPAVNDMPAAAGAKAAGQVAILFEPGVGLFVSGNTYDAKDAIKDAGFFWTGKEGKYGYPTKVWAAAKSDAATSESSLVGWAGKQKTVTQTIAALKATLEGMGLSVAVETPTASTVTAAPATPASNDPAPPPVSPLPAEGIAVQFSSDRFKALAPNPVWGAGGGVDAIAARLKKTGSKPGGGLAGGVYTDSQTGLKYLAKFPPDSNMVASEVLAAQLYRALGVRVPDMRPAVLEGNATILSPWVDGLKPLASSVASFNANVPAIEKKWLAASFPVDVWLADYDVVGLSWDNLLATSDGVPIRIDPGASLMFRAGGQLKSPLPTMNAAIELDSMLFQPKGDKIQYAFADAKNDPALMVPMATAIAVYMQQGYIDALAKWTGYTMKTGLGGNTIGDYLSVRGESLLNAVLAKAGTAAPALALAAYDRKKLAKAVAAAFPAGTLELASGGLMPMLDLPGGWSVGFFAADHGFAKIKLTHYDAGTGDTTEVASLSTAIPSPLTAAFYPTAAAYFVQQIKEAIAQPIKAAPAPSPVAPVPMPMFPPSGDLTDNIAKKVAALLPGSTLVGGGMVTAPGAVGLNLSGTTATLLVATIYKNGVAQQKLEYPIPSGSLTAFIVSRAADIANAMKAFMPKPAAAPTPTLPVSSASTGAGLADVSSMTEIDALPEGSVVTGAASLGALLFVRDASGLWRELTDDGGFMPGLFSDDVYDTLGGEVLLVHEGDGTGPEADDSITLSGYYTMAQQTVGVKTKGAVATLLGKPAVAPAPAAAAAFHGDPNPWPTTGFATDLGPDPVWDNVGGSLALAARIGSLPLGPKLGSFPGGKVTDPLTGQAFYVKFFKVAEHGCTEALASRLYRALGVNAPDVRWAPASSFGSKGSGFKVALISPWKPDYHQKPGGDFSPQEREFLCREFPADVWMANYDVVGKGPATKYDNLLVSDNFGDKHFRHFLRVDQGAALDYRSTGSEKKSSNDWSTDTAKTWGSFLSSQHPTIFKVFANATPTTGAIMIQRISALVGTPAFDATVAFAGRKADFANTLKGRAGFLAGMLQAAAPTAAPAVSMPSAGPTALTVGMKGLATVLAPLIKQGEWSLLEKNDGTLYLAGFGEGIVHQINSAGWMGDTKPLPSGGYTVLAVGGNLGDTAPKDLFAQYGAPAPAAAPAATPGMPTITTGFAVGKVYSAGAANVTSTEGQWSLVKSGPTDLYVGGFGGGKFHKIGPTGWVGNDLPLPIGNYTVLALGDEVGAAQAYDLYAKYAGAPAPAPAPAAAPVASGEAVKALIAKVEQIIASKGFATLQPLTLTTYFSVLLYEGSETHPFPIQFTAQGEKVFVTLGMGGNDIGLFSPSKAGAADAIATAVMAALRLKMANLNLTKQPPGAAPVAAAAPAGSVTVGTSLTTVEQVAALPVGSVVAYGTNTGTKVLTGFVICVASDEWRFLSLVGEPKGSTFLSSELIGKDEQWAVVVIRVGAATNLDPFYAYLPTATGKSGSATTFFIPLGA